MIRPNEKIILNQMRERLLIRNRPMSRNLLPGMLPLTYDAGLMDALHLKTPTQLMHDLLKRGKQDYRSGQQFGFKYDLICIHDIDKQGLYNSDAKGDEFSLTSEQLNRRITDLLGEPLKED